MKSDIKVKKYNDIPHNLNEIKCYMRLGKDNLNFDSLIYDCLSECENEFDFKVCFGLFDISLQNNEIDFGFDTIVSKNLFHNLSGCDKAVIFAATAGIGIDRLIRLYTKTDSARSLCIDAIGSEAVESLCDCFENEIKKGYDYSAKRYSPGYGDLPLDFQKSVFKALSCEKNIGLYLNESLLMVPTKSVTAIIGVSNEIT